MGDNNTDKARKGRAPSGDLNPTRRHPENLARGIRSGAYTKPEKRRKGELNGAAKLTENDVRTLRQMHSAGLSYTELGRMFNVTIAAARYAALGITWKHL